MARQGDYTSPRPMDTKDISKQWDKRTLDRHMRKGTVSRKDLEKYLKALPDSSEKGISMEEVDEDDDEDDDDDEA
jgi:hypothetical protein